jgi:hypothetical protein
MASRHYGEQVVSRQLVQARLADSAMWLHAWACTLSRLDRDIRDGRNNKDGTEFTRDKTAAEFFMAMAEDAIDACFRSLFENSDTAAVAAAEAALAHSATLPNDRFAIPEASPIARGTGRAAPRDGIKQFPGNDGQFEVEEIGNRE